MSDYAFDYPTGREIKPEPSSWVFGSQFMTATPEALAMCRNAGFRELSADEVDFERTTRKKFFVKDEDGYYRYHLGTLETAGNAGVSAYFVLPPGYLVLLERPNSERIASERLGDVPRGYQADPSLRVRPQWQPGQPASRPSR